MRVHLRQSGLGQTEDPSLWNVAISKFREARAYLDQLNSLVRSDVEIARTQAANLLEAEKSYQALRERFTFLYRARFGTVPPGLAALPSLAAIGTAAGIAAILVLLAALVLQLREWISQSLTIQSLKAETAKVQAQTGQQATLQAGILYEQARQAEAAGNPALAAQLRAQAQQIIVAAQRPSDEGFEKYAPYLLFGGLGLAVVMVARS